MMAIRESRNDVIVTVGISISRAFQTISILQVRLRKSWKGKGERSEVYTQNTSFLRMEINRFEVNRLCWGSQYGSVGGRRRSSSSETT